MGIQQHHTFAVDNAAMCIYGNTYICNLNYECVHIAESGSTEMHKLFTAASNFYIYDIHSWGGLLEVSLLVYLLMRKLTLCTQS